MDLRIPPGTQPGDTLKLHRKGVPDTNRPSIRGDHCFVVKVSIPKKLRFVSCRFLSVYVVLFTKRKLKQRKWQREGAQVVRGILITQKIKQQYWYSAIRNYFTN